MAYGSYSVDQYGLNSDSYSLYTSANNDRQGQFSSYGGGHGGGCCPLVIDTLTFLSLIGFIALATYFFNIQIAASMLARDFPLLPNWMRINWIIQGRKLACAIGLKVS